MPTKNKERIVSNEKLRIMERCHNKEQAQRELTKFDGKLRMNGYNEEFIQRTNKSQTRVRRRRQTASAKPFLFTAPFVGDKVDRQLKSLFKKMGIPVIMAHPSKTLRSALQKKRTQSQRCNIENCACPKDLCFSSFVVYLFKCSVCHSRYIGSTKRWLHLRVREHLTMDTSAVYKHKMHCPTAQWEISILAKAKDLVDLRIKEYTHIRQKKPQLNNKEDTNLYCLL
jgi:hypothetical protein